MTHDTEAERSLFEAVASDDGKWPKAIERDAKGNYLLLQTANGWMWWQAARRAPAAPVPQGWKLVPVELLERIQESLGSFVSDQGWSQSDMDTADALDGLLAAAPQPPEAEENPLQEQLDEALQSLEFYKRRCDLLQSIQPRMRDPERTMVCDVLANGHLLQSGDGQPDKARYAPPEAAPVELPEYGIDTASHAGIRVRGYTEQQVRELLANHGIKVNQ